MHLRSTVLSTFALLSVGACSGAGSYSELFSQADMAYIRETTLHLSAALSATDSVEPRRAEEVPRIAAFRRTARAELNATAGLGKSNGFVRPTVSEVRRHVAEHPDAGPGALMPTGGFLETVDAAAVDRARSYLRKGRHPALISTARKGLDARTSTGVPR
ncbi:MULTISPECIES: hypothetical protein [unclassified Aeromicrobium]|uniref:hypothetical protein n=1 Tax=unclassified Aeromicrobium TaxID=2633570 RepID=UPI00257EB04F|nr:MULTISPECIES: hypothetical protein [unclassified Aeromicrobium]